MGTHSISELLAEHKQRNLDIPVSFLKKRDLRKSNPKLTFGESEIETISSIEQHD